MLKSSFQCVIIFFAFLLVANIAFSQSSRQSATIGNCPGCDLSGRDFSGQDLTDINLNFAILDNANFENAILDGAMLSSVSAKGANFKNAQLNDSKKGPTTLDNADLTNANFNGAQMNGARLEYATITSADFSNTDLRTALFGPILYYDVEVNNTNKVKFRNCKLSCEFPWYWIFFDLTGTRKPICSNVTQEAEEETVNESSDSAVVNLSGKFMVAADSVIFNRVKDQLVLKTYSDTIFVKSDGTDSDNCGSATSPCQTIGKGIDRCSGSGCAVFVYFDQYRPSTSINLKNGVDLIGGYFPNSPFYQSDVFAPADGSPAFVANGVTEATLVQGFIINGTNATSASKASTGVKLINSSNITFSNVNVNAKFGGHGNGGSASAKGADGNKGGDGSGSSGGAGGTASCSNANGGKGGDQEGISNTKCECCAFLCVEKCIGYTATEYPGWSGSPGSTGTYASGGSPGHNTLYSWPSSDHPSRPGPGGNGTNATSCGSGGSPSTVVAGTFVNNEWVPSKGGDGTGGGAGGGGGGGGSGGSCGYMNFVGSCSFYKGAPGGGGGAGGCGATPGGGGYAGGPSFGVVLINSSITAGAQFNITAGQGGKGGDGYNGASGGKGGAAGNGRSISSPCNDGNGGSGGNGGAGGAGAASGGGAGGNGGASICIALVGTSAVNGIPIYYQGTSGLVGLKGTGGAAIISGVCKGKDGSNGNNGTVANTHQY